MIIFIRRLATSSVAFCVLSLSWSALSQSKPEMLRADALVNPLGIDSPRPKLSWELRDTTRRAVQTAYEVKVYSRMPKTIATKADVWDSGKVTSDVSTGISYDGPPTTTSTRYYWRVQVWGRNGSEYPVSDVQWWETGLMGQSNWRGRWIGYEEAELHAVRESGAQWITNTASSPALPDETHHNFRFHFALDGPVKHAVLYATGKDTAAAWLNGLAVMEGQPVPPWNDMPFGTYFSSDVTQGLHSGDNILAIGVTRYKIGAAKQVSTLGPMSACLYVVLEDGSTKTFRSDSQLWRASLNAPDGWWTSDFNDSNWPAATLYNPNQEVGADPAGMTPPWPTGPVVALRHEFNEAQQVVSARLYATALGTYEFHLNGNRVGDQLLSPGWSDYRDHVYYQVYDVTSLLKKGPNTIAAYLAAGWYSTPLTWFRQPNNYGQTAPALMAQLRIEHPDGTVEWVATGPDWKGATSPILHAEIYDGQTTDARRELPGWDMPGVQRKTWNRVMVVEPNSPQIAAQDFPPIRIEREMKSKTIASPSPGVYIVDFGQNMAALPRLRVTGHRGDEIQLRFGELLNPDGTLYVTNLRSAKATDRFILSGKGPEEFQPTFTFHGFRYAEITGLREKPSTETLVALVLHSDAPFSVQFSTGNDIINRLWSNIMWGQRSNFVGLPTDCPQRDERLGWSADAQVFWRTASYNMDLTNFSRKYATDLRGTQVGTAMYGIFAPGTFAPNPGYGAAWSDAGIIIPWTSWKQSGDTRIIEENWHSMHVYMTSIEAKNPSYLWRNDYGNAFGDWLTPTATTPEDLLATAYWAYDASLMREMASAVDRFDEAQQYEALSRKIKLAFQEEYVHTDGTVDGLNTYPSIPPPTAHPTEEQTRSGARLETQTGYVLALRMNLLPVDLQSKAADHLVKLIQTNNWLLGTGFLGTPYLLEVLSDTGHSDIAYRLLLNTEYPSWGYLVEHGATTMWERWNGDKMRGDPSMNSYNHYAYGAVAEWLYRYAAGVDTKEAGFKLISLHPIFERRLKHIEFAYDSPFGKVQSNWKIVGEEVEWTVSIPPNTGATIEPRKIDVRNLTLNGVSLEKSPEATRQGDGVYKIGSGIYEFLGTLSEE